MSGMKKRGCFRAFRNLFIGWLTHANHSRDRTERLVHWAIELTLVSAVLCVWFVFLPERYKNWGYACLLFMIIHSLWWIVNGNFHVYLLDSFLGIHNPGIDSVLRYIQWISDYLSREHAVICVLIYGSFCRGEFHIRSDLDIRILRRKGSKGAGRLLLLAIYFRFVSLLRGIPMDLQVVDSIAFLECQMRNDEHPVIAYCREGFEVDNKGLSLQVVLSYPNLVLKRD